MTFKTDRLCMYIYKSREREEVVVRYDFTAVSYRPVVRGTYIIWELKGRRIKKKKRMKERVR